jgi:hypothetical protein
MVEAPGVLVIERPRRLPVAVACDDPGDEH